MPRTKDVEYVQSNGLSGAILLLVAINLILSVAVMGALMTYQPEPVDYDRIGRMLDVEITIPESEMPDFSSVEDLSERVEDICESVDCEGTNINDELEEQISDYVLTELTADDEEELRNLMEDITFLDDDDFEVRDVDLEDDKVTCKDEDACDDGDYNVLQYLRIRWKDVDEEDSEVTYVLIRSTITDYEDDKDLDFKSILIVDRNYEI